MKSCRIFFPLFKSSLRRTVSSFSSSIGIRFSSFSAGDSNSRVYQQYLISKPPEKIKWQQNLMNSVSLIGWIIYPMKKRGNSSACTVLGITPSGKSNKMILISLEMRDKLAEISLKHLKPNDYVYVSGHLRCNTSVDESGKSERFYKVIVKDLNYVEHSLHSQTSQKPQSLGLQEEPMCTSGMQHQEHKDSLHLWQVFFTNPYEWWDNRGNKIYPGAADFRHKYTGEALWLDPKDPPWVRAQLQRLDSRMLNSQETDFGNARRHVSFWKYEE